MLCHTVSEKNHTSNAACRLQEKFELPLQPVSELSPALLTQRGIHIPRIVNEVPWHTPDRELLPVLDK